MAHPSLLSSRRAAILRTVALSFRTPLLAFWPLQSSFGLSIPTTLLCLAVLRATGTGVALRVLAQRRAIQTPSGRLLVSVRPWMICRPSAFGRSPPPAPVCALEPMASAGAGRCWGC